MIREEDVHTCPGCNQSDRVERIRIRDSDPADLGNWFCHRCLGRLSALPALPARSQPTEQKPKRKRGGSDGTQAEAAPG